MNCTEFRTALSAAAENRECPAPEVAAHLDGCDDPCCRAEWDEALLLQRAIAKWRSTRPKIDVADTVLAAWKDAKVEDVPATVRTLRGSTRQTRSRTAQICVAVSAAAVGLLAVVLVSTGPERPVAHTEKPALHRDSAGDAGLAYVTYAQNAAQIVTDAVVLTLGGAEQMEDPKVEPVGIGWEADWPPMGELHAALDDLMESLPADPPQS